jgi:hypothetical protein
MVWPVAAAAAPMLAGGPGLWPHRTWWSPGEGTSGPRPSPPGRDRPGRATAGRARRPGPRARRDPHCHGRATAHPRRPGRGRRRARSCLGRDCAREPESGHGDLGLRAGGLCPGRLR